MLRHHHSQPRLQALSRQLTAGVNNPLAALVGSALTSSVAVKETPTLAAQVASNAVQRAGYSPLKLDIGSMRRLRVTKGIYLPSDTPMHGIFGSKDVIHS